MVRGIELFRDHFSGFQDRYVLIGGTASTLAMEELGVDFRATKDLDIVLCVEALDREFVEKFWEFVRKGGYQNQQRSTGKRLFYRFSKPENPEFPEMLELFSKVPDALQITSGSHLTPIPVDDEVSSLSAILLDDAYYSLIHERKRVVSDLTIIGPDCLIPLKARAFTDMTDRKNAGEPVSSRDIRKHRNDIIRLYSIIDPSDKPIIQASVKSDLSKAFDLLRSEDIDPKALGVAGITVSQIVQELEAFYGLD